MAERKYERVPLWYPIIQLPPEPVKPPLSVAMNESLLKTAFYNPVILVISTDLGQQEYRFSVQQDKTKMVFHVNIWDASNSKFKLSGGSIVGSTNRWACTKVTLGPGDYVIRANGEGRNRGSPYLYDKKKQSARADFLKKRSTVSPWLQDLEPSALSELKKMDSTTQALQFHWGWPDTQPQAQTQVEQRLQQLLSKNAASLVMSYCVAPNVQSLPAPLAKAFSACTFSVCDDHVTTLQLKGASSTATARLELCVGLRSNGTCRVVEKGRVGKDMDVPYSAIFEGMFSCSDVISADNGSKVANVTLHLHLLQSAIVKGKSKDSSVSRLTAPLAVHDRVLQLDCGRDQLLLTLATGDACYGGKITNMEVKPTSHWMLSREAVFNSTYKHEEAAPTGSEALYDALCRAIEGTDQAGQSRHDKQIRELEERQRQEQEARNRPIQRSDSQDNLWMKS